MRKVLLLLLFCLSLISCRHIVNYKAKKQGLNGYYDRDWEWISTVKTHCMDSASYAAFDEESSRIPYRFLDSLQAVLDSNMYARHCFRMMYSEDGTRFHALFIVKYDDPVYPNIEKTSYHFRNMPDSLLFQGYDLYGMYYNNRWHYFVGAGTAFHSESLQAARDFYENLKLCTNSTYFSTYKSEGRGKYWDNGIYKPMDFSWANDSSLIGVPYIVRSAKFQSNRRRVDRLEHETNALMQKFHGNDSAVVLIYFNQDTTCLLIQSALPNDSGWIIDYFYQDLKTGNLFRYNGLPPKTVPVKSDLYNVFYQDINTLMQVTAYTGKGFSRLIRNDTFWQHFIPERLTKVN